MCKSNNVKVSCETHQLYLIRDFSGSVSILIYFNSIYLIAQVCKLLTHALGLVFNQNQPSSYRTQGSQYQGQFGVAP